MSKNILQQKEWEPLLFRTILSEDPHLPTLIKANGDVHPLKDINAIQSHQLGDKDLILVGPHGNMLPPTALAIRQGLFGVLDGQAIFHIDAHYDDQRQTSIGTARLSQRDINWTLESKIILANEVSRRIDEFLSCDDKDAPTKFAELINYLGADIQIFLAGLSQHFKNIGASIRKPDTDTILNYPASPDYFKGSSRSDKPLGDIIRTTKIGVYSIDADFGACVKETEGTKTQLQFEARMFFLMEALKAELERKASDKNQHTLYTLSLDPNYCDRKREFLRRFMNKFYIPLIKDAKAA